MKLRKETMQFYLEECECEWCGWPIYVGDRYFQDEETSMVFCCGQCAQEYRKYVDGKSTR